MEDLNSTMEKTFSSSVHPIKLHDFLEVVEDKLRAKVPNSSINEVVLSCSLDSNSEP